MLQWSIIITQSNVKCKPLMTLLFVSYFCKIFQNEKQNHHYIIFLCQSVKGKTTYDDLKQWIHSAMKNNHTYNSLSYTVYSTMWCFLLGKLIRYITEHISMVPFINSILNSTEIISQWNAITKQSQDRKKLGDVTKNKGL